MAAPEGVHMFNSYGDAEMFISQFEEETSTAFVKCHTRNHGMDNERVGDGTGNYDDEMQGKKRGFAGPQGKPPKRLKAIQQPKNALMHLYELKPEPQVEQEEVKADVFPEIIEPELKIPKYPSRERKPKETDIEYSRPPYNPVEKFVPEEYRGQVSQGVLKSALVNSHRDEVLLRQRGRVETVYVKTFTDIPYKLKGLALPASEIDPNVFNLLCDWDNLEEKLA